jgi:hypothetical protein
MKKASFIAVAALLVISLSVAHMCFAAKFHCDVCAGQGNISDHKPQHEPQKCSFCDGEMRFCSITSGLSEDRTVITAASPLSLIPVQAGVPVQIASMSVNPVIGCIIDVVGLSDVAPRPIYLINLSLIC